jgi:hypothetical protein
VVLPSLGATKAWDTSNLYTGGVLSVVSVALPGDHNLDGTVDAADYVMWQKVSGGTPQGYADWVANFGASAGSGGTADDAAQAGVPEPATIVWCVVLTTFMVVRPATRERRLR